MKIRIKLSTGKTLHLTPEELRELWGMPTTKKIFAIVFHSWFQDSKGFDVYYIQATDEREARKEALLIKEHDEGTFNRMAFKIVEVFPETVDLGTPQYHD